MLSPSEGFTHSDPEWSQPLGLQVWGSASQGLLCRVGSVPRFVFLGNFRLQPCMEIGTSQVQLASRLCCTGTDLHPICHCLCERRRGCASTQRTQAKRRVGDTSAQRSVACQSP